MQSSGRSYVRLSNTNHHPPSESASKAIAQYSADARLHAVFEQSGESGRSFHYSNSLRTTATATASASASHPASSFSTTAFDWAAQTKFVPTSKPARHN